MRKFKRMKAFARFKNEFWCLDVAYVDELGEDNNGVKYIPARQDLFDRTIDIKDRKQKIPKNIRAFLTMITKKQTQEDLGQKLQILLVVEKNSKQQQRVCEDKL